MKNYKKNPSCLFEFQNKNLLHEITVHTKLTIVDPLNRFGDHYLARSKSKNMTGPAPFKYPSLSNCRNIYLICKCYCS